MMCKKMMQALALSCDECGTTTEYMAGMGAPNLRGHLYGLGWRYKAGAPSRSSGAGRCKDTDLCPECAAE